MVILGVIVIAAFVTGLLLRKIMFGYAAVLLLIIFHGIRYNKMMAYVEQNAFDGKGNE